MRTVKRIFEYTTDEDDRSGWLMKGMWNFDPADALNVVHDIFEHRPNGAKEFAGEIEAFGVMAYIRGGKMQGPSSKTQGQDLWSLFVTECDLERAWQVTPYPHKSYPCRTEYGVDTSAEDRLQEIAEIFWNTAENDKQRWADYMSPSLPTDLIAYLRQGYRWAQRRYRQIDIYAFFWDIHDLINSMKAEGEGEELHVSACLLRQTCIIKRLMPDAFSVNKAYLLEEKRLGC